MAHTIVLICILAVAVPTMASADIVSPVALGNHLATVGVVIPRDGSAALPGDGMPPVGIVIPADERGLISVLSTEARTMDRLHTSIDCAPSNNCLSPVTRVVPLPVAQPAGNTADLKFLFLAVILFGALVHFLTSPNYADFWNRLFSPLNWD
jgi:hypothetical protein